MLTDETLRTMLADPGVRRPLSPAAVRRRAGRLRRGRRLRRLAAVAVLAPAVGFGVMNVAVSGARPPVVDSPVVYGASPADQLPDGRLPLQAADQYAWAGPDGLCRGKYAAEGHSCVPTQEDSTGPANFVWDHGTGLAVAVVKAPVVKAEFYNGAHVDHGQPVSFARYPEWRLISADLTWPDDNGPVHLGIRGWDAAGKLVLDLTY